MQRCRGETLHDRLQRLRIGVWVLENLASREIPMLANDLAVNDQDAGFAGRTDCVDNATNTTTFLPILRDLTALDGWQVGDPQVRDRLTKDVHSTVTVVDEATGQRWAIDSWLGRHGHLPFVSPLRDWSAGRKPWEAPKERYNPYSPILEQLCPRTSAK